MFESRKIICLTCTCWTHSYEKNLHGYHPNNIFSSHVYILFCQQFCIAIFLHDSSLAWPMPSHKTEHTVQLAWVEPYKSEGAFIWLVAYLHEITTHEQMQADGIRPIRASLSGLAGSMQDKDDRPTCQSHRLDRLHPLMQATKQHLSFSASAHSTSLNTTLFYEIQFHSTCIPSFGYTMQHVSVNQTYPIWPLMQVGNQAKYS